MNKNKNAPSDGRTSDGAGVRKNRSVIENT